MALENLEPATRIESILDGEDIAPATRLEYFLKQAANSGGGGGGVVGVFRVVGVYDTDTRSIQVNKTLEEIRSAANSGLLPYLSVTVNGTASILQCNMISDTNVKFVSVDVNINNTGDIIAITSSAVTINADGTVTNESGWKTF